MALFFMYPQSWRTSENRKAFSGRHPFADIRDLTDKPAYGPALWRMNVKYRSEAGKLRVTLNHKNNKPIKGLRLVAFFSRNGTQPVAWTRLQNPSKGIYQSDEIHLERGEYIMSVIGRRWSELVFMLEEPFVVK